jgi:hypothetical protein
MTAMKRRGARKNREQRDAGRSVRSPAAAAQQDLAESQRRAKAAKTPIAKVATRQVLERKQRAYSGQAAREAGGGTAKRATAAGKKPAAKKAPRRKG